jgi:hypothetical protein
VADKQTSTAPVLPSPIGAIIGGRVTGEHSSQMPRVPGLRARSSTDRASAFEAEGCRFEPCRAHHAWQMAGDRPSLPGRSSGPARACLLLRRAACPARPSERRLSSFPMRRAMLPGRCSSGTWAQRRRRPSEIPRISPLRASPESGSRRRSSISAQTDHGRLVPAAPFRVRRLSR